MNEITMRIRERLSSVQRDESNADRQIRDLQSTIQPLTSSMHRLEFQSLSDATQDTDQHSKTLHDVMALRQQRAALKQTESELLRLREKMKKIEKTIDSHKFWLDYANTTDVRKQNEANNWFTHKIDY